MLGVKLGDPVGASLAVSTVTGTFVGKTTGLLVSSFRVVGVAVGDRVEGEPVGDVLGVALGDFVGAADGLAVGS